MPGRAIAVLDRFCCPGCKGEITLQGQEYVCAGCGGRYPLRGGLIDFIPPGVDKAIQESIKGWSNIGYSYDEYIARANARKLKAIDDPLLKYCTAGKLVLEIGCGTARLRGPVEKRGAVYTGIDPSLKLLRDGMRPGEGDLCCGVGEYLPFRDQSFEVILGGYCSFRYIRWELLMSECARVLKPGGMMVFTLWSYWSFLFSEIWESIRYGRWDLKRFKKGLLHDVVWPWQDVSLLRRFSFQVRAIFSTRMRFLSGSRFFSKNPAYWQGKIGVFLGHDIIFICQKEDGSKTKQVRRKDG